jgi:mannan endo-1,4-beta-mannosidase
MERLPWIETRKGHPYFFTEHGEAWTPVGHNDAITWPELAGLFRRRDVEGVERHLRSLKAAGITCIRLMLEYCQTEHRYIERPAGVFPPNMVRLWDDLFAMCERVGIYVLLTPFDTFFTWIRWKNHPYNKRNGGPCSDRSALLACSSTREAIKARLEFATRQWGGSPALFGWDIWNEMHPAHAGGQVEPLAYFIDEVAPWLKALELSLHGRRHPVTVSVFGRSWSHPLPSMRLSSAMPSSISRTSTSTRKGPSTSRATRSRPALATGRLMAAALGEIEIKAAVRQRAWADPRLHGQEDRAFGAVRRRIFPSHAVGASGERRRRRRHALAEPHPHVLTQGMRRRKARLACFLPLIDWTRFERRCWNDRLELGRRASPLSDAAIQAKP